MTPPKAFDEDGAATIEFALVVPLLIMLIVAVVELGFMFNAYQGLQAAAREGARLASIQGQTAATVTARVDSALNGVALEGSRSVSITPTTLCDSDATQSVAVAVTAPASINIPFYGGLGTISLTGRGNFRCE